MSPKRWKKNTFGWARAEVKRISTDFNLKQAQNLPKTCRLGLCDFLMHNINKLRIIFKSNKLLFLLLMFEVLGTLWCCCRRLLVRWRTLFSCCCRLLWPLWSSVLTLLSCCCRLLGPWWTPSSCSPSVSPSSWKLSRKTHFHINGKKLHDCQQRSYSSFDDYFPILWYDSHATHIQYD